MKTIILMLLFFACCVIMIPRGLALDEISREEVIEEASCLSGLTKDTLELIYDEAPSLFDNLEKITFAVKVVHLFATAQDNEMAEELFDRFVDDLKPLLLPNPLQTFLTAVKVYKTSLEVIRDYVTIPRFEESIYQSYRAVRLSDWKRKDTSEESKNTAFASAVMGWSGYYLVQDKTYQELLKKKGYNPNLITSKLEKRLRSQIDTFWMNTLELRFQREILAQEKSAITAELWQNAAGDIARLRQEVAQRFATPSPPPLSSPEPEETAIPFTESPLEPPPSPKTQEEGGEEAGLFLAFRESLKTYIEAEIARAGGEGSFFCRSG